ncbi:MAG TPA: FAD:protein FMN transferase [Thermomicrobiaceae bacterium]|nr:FAD:protein FMN transferase [Thermomicrobiaceae bacterium]
MIAKMHQIDSPAFAEFQALGSTIVVGVTAPDRLERVLAHVHARVIEIDRALSRFRADSELRRLEATPGKPRQVTPLFMEALERSVQAARSTAGLFDPTVRDAVEAAGYDRSIERLEAEGPGPARVALPAGAWERIQYDPAWNIVTLPEGVRLDFGGIGKGLAVDYALRGLQREPFGVLVSAGGDLAVAGPAPGEGWLCGISVTADAPLADSVLLSAGALATSGLGRRQWQRDGQRLHHLIDPRTGRPAESPWQFVTVAAESCVVAEVLTKAAWLLGAEGPEWLARRGFAGRFQGQHGNVVTVGDWPMSQGDGGTA